MSLVLSRVEGLRKVGGHFVALCPAHPDQSPSLSIDEGDDGRVLLVCRAGCSFEDVVARSAFEVGDLFPSSASANGNDRRQIVAEYSYTDEEGRELFQVVRFAPKTFRQRRWAPDDPKADRDGWSWNLQGTRRVLYRLPDVLEAVAAGVEVYVVEGEKDVAAVDAVGEVATTCPMGAGKWRKEYSDVFQGGDVIIVADADAPGRAHAREVAGALEGVAARVVVVESPTHKDVADHLAAGLSLDELVTLAVDEAGEMPGDYGQGDEEPVIGGTEAQATTDPERDLLNVTLHASARRLLVDGGAFILDAPEHVEAVWGSDERVVWSKGEPLLICGPAGVGKTTIAQQLTLARAGLAPDLLGFAVAADERRVLYLASDRPTQAQRSFRRMVDEDDRKALDERLTIWRGPLPYPITKRPEILVALAEEFGAGTIIIDSLKDVALKLSEDEPGGMVNQAFQMAVANGVEVAALHHQRKGQQGVGKPRSLADVYGSTWITAGAGSVVLIWGEPGDAVVELTHLKQPLEDIGPLTLLHDHHMGRTTVQGNVDLWDVVRTSNGLTPEGAARAIFGSEGVQPNQTEKARRRLDGLVKRGSAYKVDAGKDDTGRQRPARYYATPPREENG